MRLWQQIGFEQLRSVVRSEGTRGGLTRERERAPLKSGVNDRKKKEDGMKQSQRLFLTWLIEDERLFDLTEGYISPDDFTEEIFRDVAKVLYEQHAAGEINPAQIISRFTDEEQQREAAALFHARLHPVETRQEHPRPKFNFDRGDEVRVVDGPFGGFNGVVEDVNYDKGKLRVSVSIFGRQTPVELDFIQVSKG